MKIIIWDKNPERIHAIERNLSSALRNLSLRASIAVASETPLLARMCMLSRMPVLEIDGVQWHKKPEEIFSEQDCEDLLRDIIKNS